MKLPRGTSKAWERHGMGLHPSLPLRRCTSSKKFLFQILSPKTYNRAEAPTSHSCHGNYKQLGPWERWEGPAHPPAGGLAGTCQDHPEAEGQRWFGPAGFREVWKEIMRQRAGFCFCAFPPASAGAASARHRLPRTSIRLLGSRCPQPGLPKGPRGSSRLTGGLGKSPSGKHKLQSGSSVPLAGRPS